MRKPRFACALVRNFALRLWLARQPGTRSGAVALADRPGDAAVIRQCSDDAAKAGVRPGMTAAQGHSLCADLHVISFSDVPVEAEAQKLVAHLQNLSPEVEARAPGMYLLLASGLARLYGSEAGFAATVVAAVRSHSLPVTVGVADTTTAARIAALISAPGTFTIIPRGREQRFLQRLDVDFLQPTPRVAQQLKALGLSTFAQIAALPAGELVRRFGPEGALLHDLACGLERTRFCPAALPSDRSCAASFAPSLTRLPAVIAHLHRLTDELFGALLVRGCAAAALHVELQLEDGTSEHLALAVSRPAVSAAPFLRQVNERLLKIRFLSGVIRLAATLGGVTQAASPQLELRRPGRLCAASAGSRSVPSSPTAVPVSIPRLVTSHLPEESFEFSAGPKARARAIAADGASVPAYASGSLAGLRLFSPPCRTTVTEQRGTPQTLRLDSRIEAIRRRQGPWELSGRWWGEDFDRRYFEVQTDGARRYLLFFDRGSAFWYLQGVFD